MTDRIEILQTIAVFGGLQRDTLQFLLDRTRRVSVAAGDWFFRENDTGSTFYVLEQGEVTITRHWQGSDYELSRRGEGDCFGEMSLIDLYPRSASVQALTDCRAIELSNAELYELYQHDLEQFTLIQMNIGRELSRRLREATGALFEARFTAHEGLPADYPA